MKLYHLEGCPYCRMVTDRLQKLGLAYDKVEVPPSRSQRQEVFAVSGQWTVPVLVLDDGTVFDDEDKILAYLDKTHPAPHKA